MKQQDETNQKEIKKLSQKITELNNENRNLVLQLEEMKRQEKEKIDNIENITKNLNLKEKETKTFKETLMMIKKENENLLKENQDFKLVFESIQKNISEDQNRIINEMKNSLEGFKDKESNLNTEIKSLKSNNDQIKKEYDSVKRDLDSVKLKMEMKSQENTSLKEEMKSLRQLLKQNKENDSQILAYTTQIENLENLVKRFGEDIEKFKKSNSDLKNTVQEKQKIIEDLSVNINETDKSRNELKTLLVEKDKNVEEMKLNDKMMKDKIADLEKNNNSKQINIVELSNNIKSLNQKINLLEKNEKDIQNLLNDKDNQGKDYTIANKKLQDRIIILENSQKELEKQLSDKESLLKDSLNNRSNLEEKLIKKEKSQIDLQNEIKEKDNKIEKLTEAEKVLKKRIEEIVISQSSLQEQLKDRNNSYNDISQVNNNLKVKTEELESAISNLHIQIKAKEKDLQTHTLSSKENVTSLENELEKLRKENKTKDEKLNDLSLLVKNIKEEKEIIISKSNNKISDLEEKIANLKNENEILLKDKDNKEIFDEYLKKIDELEKQENNIKLVNENLNNEIENQRVSILEVNHLLEIEKEKNSKQSEEIIQFKSKLDESKLNIQNLQTEISDISICRDELIIKLESLTKSEITYKNTVLEKEKRIIDLEAKANENDREIKSHLSSLDQLNEEFNAMKDENESLNRLCKKTEIEKISLQNEIKDLSKEYHMKFEDQKAKEDQLKTSYQELNNKISDIENENKKLATKIDELNEIVNKQKNYNSQLIDIISLFNSSNISFSKLLYGEDTSEDLLEIFSNLSNSLGIISDKSVQTQIIAMINETYDLFKRRVELINEEITNTKNIVDTFSEETENQEKNIESILILLISNDKGYCEKYKTTPYQKKNNSKMHEIIIELIKYHNSVLSNLVDTSHIHNIEFTQRNNELSNEVNTIKGENADLNSQIELLNEDIVGLKENSKNFLKKLLDIGTFIVTKMNEVGISLEKELEVRNEELVLFETIKTALPILIETIIHLRDKDEIDEENCIQVLCLTYRNNSFTLLLKENEFIWKDTALLNLDSKGSGVKKHEEFIIYNIDKETEEMNDLKELFQAKEEECLELTKHLENLQNSDKNQYEEELERITNEFNDKLEKMDQEKQQFLEDKIKEMNEILASNQSEFDEEKETIIKNEKENYLKEEEALKKGFDIEKSNLLKQFEEDKNKIINEYHKKSVEVENNYRNLIKSKDDEFMSLNLNFKNDLTTLKNQVAVKESELVELRNNYSNLVNMKSKDSSELAKNQSKEIETLNKKLRECLEITIPSMQMDVNTKKEAYELLDSELKKCEKENKNLTEKLNTLSSKNIALEKEMGGLKDNKEKDEKIGKEQNDKVSELMNKNNELIKEIKVVKNRMADLKNESELIIEEKETELNVLREEKEMFLTEKEKVEKIVQNILFTISVFDDNKNFSKFRKNFYENEMNKDKKSINSNDMNDEDAYSIYRDLDEITRIVENLHKRINDLQRFEAEKNEEKKTLEKKLEEMNKNADTRLKEFSEENKKLLQANEDYSKKIMEAIQSKAPHLLLNSSSNSSNLKKSDEIFKTIDLFKNYNEELSKMNSELEAKMLKAIEKAKKYKNLYNESKSTTKSDISQPLFYDPKRYRINSEKTLYNLKWYLLVPKRDDLTNLSYNDAVWVTASSIKEEMFDKIKDNNIDQAAEIENLKGIQEDLLDKLTRKEEELITAKRERDTMLRINSGQGLSKNTVPIEKFEFVLNQLNEESKNYRTLFSTFETMKKENEILKQEIDNMNNKSKLSKKNVSAIEKEFLSKFLDNDEEINNMFEKDDHNQNTEQTKQSPKENLNKSKLEDRKDLKEKKTNISSVSQKETVHNFSMNVITKNKDNEQQYERRMSQHSIKSKKDIIPTQGNDSMKDNLMKMEEEQKLFAEQLLNIKEELKETRKQKENFKKLYEQCLSFKDEKKTEIVNILKQAFEKLIQEITITPKVKELIFVILKVIDYNEEQINNVIKKKENEKKGIFGGLFSKK